MLHCCATVGGILHYFGRAHAPYIALLNFIWCDWGGRKLTKCERELAIYHINVKWTCNKLDWYRFQWFAVSKRRQQRRMQIKWFIFDDIHMWRLDFDWTAYTVNLMHMEGNFSIFIHYFWIKDGNNIGWFARIQSRFQAKINTVISSQWKTDFPLCNRKFRLLEEMHKFTQSGLFYCTHSRESIQIYRDDFVYTFDNDTVISHSTFRLK